MILTATSMAHLPWVQVYHRGGSSESPDPHHCPQFPHLSIWELGCVICKVSASSSGPPPLVLYPLGTFPLTPIVVCNTDDDIRDSSYFWITLGLAVTTVGWLTLLLSFWRYLADVFKPWNFRAHSAILPNSFLVCFCGIWGLLCFLLSLSKKVEFFGSLSLTLTLLTLRLFTEVLSFGLGVERSHSDSDSHGQQPGAGESWTWENRQPHVVRPTGGLAPAWKSAYFEWSKIPHFPGPTGFLRG